MAMELTLRILNRTRPNDRGCLEWTGANNGHGYGRINVGGMLFYVHRVIFQEANGEIAPGLDVCHSCDNPPCCNKDHLFLGSAGDNARDMIRKGRHFLAAEKAKTHCDRGHLLSGSNAYIYRSTGRRQCMACQKITTAARVLSMTDEQLTFRRKQANARSIKHYQKIKDDPDFKEKNASRAREWWRKNKGVKND